MSSETKPDDAQRPIPDSIPHPMGDNTRGSIVSNTSYNPSEVGKAVSVAMVNSGGAPGEVKQMYVDHGLSSKPIAEDEESVFSGSVTLGRLDTVKSVDVGTVQPDLTVNTPVESVVPPRLRRRPVSEAPAAGPMVVSSPRSAKRASLTLTEDLDKLMESAHFLKEDANTSKEGEKDSTQSTINQKVSPDLNVSSDAFETAEGETLSSAESTSTSAPLRLPKRPNAASLVKARQASLEYVAKRASSQFSKETSGALSIVTGSSFHTDEDLLPQEHRMDAAGDSASQKTASVLLIPHTHDSEHSETTPKVDLNALHIGARDEIDTANPVRSDGLGAGPSPKADAPLASQPLDDATPQSDLSPQQYLGPIECSSLEPADPDRQEVVDNDFYDIEEPVLVTHPSQTKIVRDNIKAGKRKKSIKRGKKSRKSEAELKLKPFSYSTLVNLLESINGTVIGEEFNSLNLPVQEKQLIEKIIDLLSRLTSDMVVDESRYAVGIARLEKAHRVLEGFM